MKRTHLIIALASLVLIVALWFIVASTAPRQPLYGGLSAPAWGGIAVALLLAGGLWTLRDTWRERRLITGYANGDAAAEQAAPKAAPERITQEERARLDPDGPDYPHPIIFPERCIGCYACVEACPHGVLQIINGISAVVARDQCMEDTACEVECPVNPKACIVIGTTKRIPKRKVPARNAAFMTDVPGCFIIGDVSGTPLIKNAANEGANVIAHIKEELSKTNGAAQQATYDVAIVGMGPAGISAAIAAARANLSYVAIEQDKVLSTIEAYPANKYVFFKPDSMKSVSPINVEGEGKQREMILSSWKEALAQEKVKVNEEESCKAVKPAEGADYFTLKTVQTKSGAEVEYTARRVILGIGNRGTPMKLGVKGEDLRVERGGMTQDKVQYKLADPRAYTQRHVIIVGAGNSAIEAAVDLVCYRDGDQITFRPEAEMNQVTLVIRSDLKNDLKFGNKRQLYTCIDEGKIKVFFGTGIKEIHDGEVVLMSARSKEERARIPNDYIFAMIGGDRPTKFLEAIGIKIG